MGDEILLLYFLIDDKISIYCNIWKKQLTIPIGKER
ncbi:putative ORfan [Saudi moumouvirus]|nr:putative ORfan [Saudi moumouvirus]